MKCSFSFEFFPPKTSEGEQHLTATAKILSELNPEYFSVTFGAGGSVQDFTYNTVMNLKQVTGIKTAPHLTCIGTSREKISHYLQQYQKLGIQEIVALRGDLPAGADHTKGDFQYAKDLVSFIRQETDDHFKIEVAAYPEKHPQALDLKTDLINFKAKVNAGANSAITQYFFDVSAYCRFVESCEKLGINIPVVPGIMPITNYHQLNRFSNTCGAVLPEWLHKRLTPFADDLETIGKVGEEIVSELCEKLIQNGAKSFHFYTLNKAEPSVAILRNLQLVPVEA